MLSRIVIVVVAVLVAVVGIWVYKTLTLETPYDEVWIGLNGMMPGPMADWACGKVMEGQPAGTLPPMSCETP